MSEPMPSIPTQSPFTYPNPNPSASPSFTQDDTSDSAPSPPPYGILFIPETPPIPTYTQPAFSQPNQSFFSQPAVHFTQPSQTNPNNFQSQQFSTVPKQPLASANECKISLIKRRKNMRMGLKDEYWIQNADHSFEIVQQVNSPKEVEKDAKGNTIVHHQFQKILSQLNQVQARPDNDDINLKFLRALPSSWSQVGLALKTRGGLDSMSFDDLYNKLRSLELDVRIGHSYSVKAAAYFPSFLKTSGCSDNLMECVLHSFVAENEQDQDMIYEDFDQVDQLEMEEMDLKWQMAMLSLRINRFEKKAGRKMNYNNQQPARFDRRKVRCYKCLQLGHFARECNVKTVDDKARYSAFKVTEVKTDEPKALVSVDSMVNWSDHAAENKTDEVAKVYGMMAGLHADNSGADISNAADEFAMMGISPKAQKEKKEWEVKTKIGLGFQEYFGVDEVFDLSTPSVFYSDPVEKEDKPLYSRFVKAGEMHAVPPPITGTYMPSPYQSDIEETQVSYGSKSDNKTSETISESNDFVSCDNSDKSSDSETHMPCDSSLRPRQKTFPPAVDIQTLPRFRYFVPCKSQAASVPAGSSNSSASITADGPDPAARPSSVHFNNMYWPNAYDPMYMTKGRWGTAVKTSAGSSQNWLGSLNGCSRSMTGNKEKLDDFVQIKGGIVKFGGGDGRISGKGTIRTSKLDFENVYYVEEAEHFNLFLVAQICDNKKQSSFTYTDFVWWLSEEFQIAYENLQPEQKVTCLVAKASLDESTRWHRRMAHVNFKTINKLAKEGLVDGLPPKGIGHEWYFDLDYLTDSLGYTRFKTDTPAGTQETNINAGTPDHDSDSEVDEQVIVVPSFPSNSFAGPSSSNGPSVMERNADYAEELAKLQRQEYEAKDAAARYGYLFSQETAEILCQAETEIRNQGVSADRDPAGIDSAGGVSAGRTSAGSDPAGDNPAVSSSVSADFNPVYADESTLPPSQSLGGKDEKLIWD
ncbi:ribonuclease H-like domain-containing protein [Tanacetum coccineum]